MGVLEGVDVGSAVRLSSDIVIDSRLLYPGQGSSLNVPNTASSEQLLCRTHAAHTTDKAVLESQAAVVLYWGQVPMGVPKETNSTVFSR